MNYDGPWGMLPLFLLGAGFNADVVGEVGPLFANSIYIGEHQIDCDYPLTADALRLCFDRSLLPAGQSIEDLFSEALKHGDYSPIGKLADRLMKADYYLAFELASTQPNCYADFFKAFDGSHFLTFNYDSLPEALLFRAGRWNPRDGYGMPVLAELSSGKESDYAAKKSASLVLHLHGSLCITTSEFHVVHKRGSHLGWIEERERPLFSFDPESIGPLFAPFRRRLGDFDIRDRIIAPVRDKSQDLTRAFVRAVYKEALKFVRYFGSLVSIGYSFNDHDRASYDPILKMLSRSAEKRLRIISPEAEKLAEKLRCEYPSIAVDPIKKTFKQWSCQGFAL